MKKRYIVVFVFFLLNAALGQVDQNQSDSSKDSSNIKKRIIFESQGKYYPITVLLSPYSFWFSGDIEIGLSKTEKEYLKRQAFMWNINYTLVDTLMKSIIDTVNIDTISSIFRTVMCECDSNDFPIDCSDPKEVIKYKSSNSFANLVKEFKYTYLLRNIDFPHDSCEVIRCIYPLNVYHPFETSYAVVELVLKSDVIEMTSYTLNIIDLLDIEVEENGNVFLNKKDFRRLMKRIKKTTFNSKVDCKVCNNKPYSDLDIVIEYRKNEFHYSFFICREISSESKSKGQKEITDYLIGLYQSIYYLNKNYFKQEYKYK